MIRLISLLVTAFSLLVGCAKTAPPMVLGPDHPAHPDAAEAPSQTRSETLALKHAIAPPSTQEEAGMRHDMRGGDMHHPSPPATAPGENAAPFAPRWTPTTVSTTAPTPAAALYACPMHPDVTSDTPGACPKCGMKLVPKHQAKPSAGQHDHGGGHP